ncbi:hypothetical protein LCGC14_2085330 [marine sediment metagenome]|uniref:Uncharacterized protein n=1 Tax=marine sediment metagenome TaxID=412755 RepID=A0A0F9HBE5_9ZZZZ
MTDEEINREHDRLYDLELFHRGEDAKCTKSEERSRHRRLAFKAHRDRMAIRRSLLLKSKLL